MKKKLITLISISCLVLFLTLLSACNILPNARDKNFSGHSQCWTVDICMGYKGTTRIVMQPRKEFIFPNTILIKIQDQDGQIHFETLTIERPSNAYSTYIPTIASTYKSSNVLNFTVYFENASERIELNLNKMRFFI